MKLSDLKTGMRVKTRGSEIYLVIENLNTKFHEHVDITFFDSYGFLCDSEYNEDLTNCYDRFYDIVEVYNPEKDGCYITNNFLDLNKKYKIWEREEVKKYYLEHKYLSGNYETHNYLNEVQGEFINLGSKDSTCDYKTEFTNEDIERLEIEYGLIIGDFIKKEVK